ncbi:hypothetical protein Ciccas_013409 [Cichlidogyrus casuarinus]|uniref:FMRFamide-activated amiloride-sensitive sodium channel n=1 Tax=Cichlidogyrus casuarinus TaxID=1844966 RepID=A0ABD2PLF4_9PLAT
MPETNGANCNEQDQVCGQMLRKRSEHRAKTNPTNTHCFETQVLEQFCMTSSIRGISKIYRSDSRVLKNLWLSYIILMISLLLFSCIKIVREYLEYNTTQQNQLIIDAPSPFPALTVCPHQVFSERAVESWQKGTMTPNQFVQRIRNAAKTLYQNDHKDHAAKLLNYETRRVYYQTLDYQQVLQLSHEMEEIFIFCKLKTKIGIYSGDKTTCGVDIKLYTSPEMFNCFTLTVKEQYRLAAETLTMYVQFPTPSIPAMYQDTAFMQDPLNYALGGVMGIHEIGTIPHNLHTQIEPDRFVQISYKTIETRQYSTPKDPCKPEEELLSNPTLKIKDLDFSYNYTYHDCITKLHVDTILEKCDCIFGLGPRPETPNNGTRQFCGYMPEIQSIDDENWKAFVIRARCIRKAKESLEKAHLLGEDAHCIRRCKEQMFETKVSNTAWTPKLWELVWLAEQLEACAVIDHKDQTLDSQLVKARQVLEAYLATSSEEQVLQHMERLKISMKTLPTNTDMKGHYKGRFASIMVKRASNNTQLQEERPSLSMYGLVSRIGGSCTLYLGLTCAFLIEIVEFFFNLRRQEDRRPKQVVINGIATKINTDMPPIPTEEHNNSLNPWERKAAENDRVPGANIEHAI